MAQAGRLLLVLAFTACFAVAPRAQSAPAPQLDDARRLFFNAHYDKAAALALSLRESAPHDFENDRHGRRIVSARCVSKRPAREDRPP